MTITRDLRERLSEAQNHRCAWNACDLRIHRPTIEHVLPVTFGGTNDPDNLVVACARCNRLRGALLEFRWYISIGKVWPTNRKRRRFFEWMEAFGPENFILSVELACGVNEILDLRGSKTQQPEAVGRAEGECSLSA